MVILFFFSFDLLTLLLCLQLERTPFFQREKTPLFEHASFPLIVVKYLSYLVTACYTVAASGVGVFQLVNFECSFVWIPDDSLCMEHVGEY